MSVGRVFPEGGRGDTESTQSGVGDGQRASVQELMVPGGAAW